MQKLKEMTLLYAEDEKITQALYKQHFSQYFKEIYTADDGQQALDLYFKIKPDVLILDINMPLIDGLQVCKKIREIDEQTKIILLTSRIDKQALMAAVELGLTSYLDKPVTKERIIEALNKLFQEQSTLSWLEGDKKYHWLIDDRDLYCEQTPIHLTKNEKALLELFLTTKHKNISYQKICDAISHYESEKILSDAAIKTLLYSLRSKLPIDTIKNEYGLGYYFSKTINKTG